MGVRVEDQKPDESPEEFYKRVINQAVEENGTILIVLDNRYVDVTPETTVEYLQGYLNGFRAGQEKPFKFMGFK